MTIWTPIPGETPIDPSGLKDRSIKTRRELCRVEEENVRKAHVKYLVAPPGRRLAPFDIDWMRRLHREMFGDVWVWAGQFRRVDLNLGITWHQVNQQVYNLVRRLRQWEDELPPEEQVVLLHHRAVQIHPFLNGNGRWARLLANIWQYSHKGGLTYWPEQTIGAATSPVRPEYLQAVKKADGGDYALLKSMHKRYTRLE
ncbi:MAG: mobile mystery protein B [Pirellulales bacterium]|nr:mobile mystery protein B [Pirellulales bacterium]